MNMDKLIDDIYEVIDFNADILPCPPAFIDFKNEDFFYTPTTRAAANKTGNYIYVNENYIDTYATNEVDLWLDFSHEMRHIWQIKTGKFEKSKYTLRGNAKNLIDYNEQYYEVDAWAWASIVIQSKLKLRPILSSLFGVNMEKLVKKREAEIAEEYGL